MNMARKKTSTLLLMRKKKKYPMEQSFIVVPMQDIMNTCTEKYLSLSITNSLTIILE